MKLEFKPFELLLRNTWTIASGAVNGGGSNTAKVILVRLTGGGLTGLGEAATSKRYSESIESMSAFLNLIDATKLSFDDVPGSMAYMEKLSPKKNYSAKCAVNVALLDGAARKAGKPIYDYLGLGFTENKHLTSFTIGIDTPEIIYKKTMEAAQYPILKLKVGAPGERENLAALRKAAPTKTVRVDANEGWATKEEALQNIELLAKDPHIEYVEQPMPAATPKADLAWLKARSPLPLYGDESYHNSGDADFCAECYHGVNVKLLKTGGVSEAYEALKAARKHGLKTMVGCMIETSVLITAAAHLATLVDHYDIDGNLLVTNDPYIGVSGEKGMLSFANTPEKLGLRVKPGNSDPFAG